MLSWLTFAPLVAVVPMLLVPSDKRNLIRWLAVLGTVPSLVISVWIYVTFDRSVPGVNDPAGFQYVIQKDWIRAFHIQYYMGIDGLSVSMVLLTALLSFLCIFASWGIDKGLKGYMTMFMILEVGMLGVFVSLDFFLFYIFWEVMLLPMYFLIGIWGGPRRIYAAIKFFLYTLFGSVLMLIAMLALYFKSGHSFNLLQLMAGDYSGETVRLFGQTLGFAKLMFVLLFIGFAIKVPTFPFHTWLPDAHVEAPTAISVILAGVLLKMGTYGMMRVSFPIFPEATLWFSTFMAVIAMINIVYGALCAMAQTDFKKLVAYSSISHMGFVLLGIASGTPQGMNGAILQMFNHGTITAMLFLLVGVIYDRAHHRELNGFGGLMSRMPVYGSFSSLAFFAALGLPGLSSFVSELLTLLGGWQTYPAITVVCTTGIILGAAYMLWTLQRVFLGPLNPRYADLPEINGREVFTLVPLAVLVVLLGFYPHPVLDLLRASSNHLVDLVWETGRASLQ